MHFRPYNNPGMKFTLKLASFSEQICLLFFVFLDMCFKCCCSDHLQPARTSEACKGILWTQVTVNWSWMYMQATNQETQLSEMPYTRIKVTDTKSSLLVNTVWDAHLYKVYPWALFIETKGVDHNTNIFPLKSISVVFIFIHKIRLYAKFGYHNLPFSFIALFVTSKTLLIIWLYICSCFAFCLHFV